MYIEGYPLATLNTMRDGLLQAIWVRHKQTHIFEVLINVMANGLALNPDISKRIDELTTEYIELVIPGSREARRRSDRDFAERTSKALSEVAKLLAEGGSGKISDKVLLNSL